MQNIHPKDGDGAARGLAGASRQITRLKRLMAFFMQEIQDSRKPFRPDEEASLPDHECGFLTRPDTGYCAFCDSWGEAFEALTAEAPEAAPRPADQREAEPSSPIADLVGALRAILDWSEGRGKIPFALVVDAREAIAKAERRS
jgi:hypothetical protein